jgi:hypothetical protein
MYFFSLFSKRKQLIKVVTLVSPYLRACYGDKNSYTIDEVNIGLDRCGLSKDSIMQQAYALFLEEKDFNAWARAQRHSISYQRIRGKIRERLKLSEEQLLSVQYLYQLAQSSMQRSYGTDNLRVTYFNGRD